jgi:hypothetical protein
MILYLIVGILLGIIGGLLLGIHITSWIFTQEDENNTRK